MEINLQILLVYVVAATVAWGFAAMLLSNATKK